MFGLKTSRVANKCSKCYYSIVILNHKVQRIEVLSDILSSLLKNEWFVNAVNLVRESLALSINFYYGQEDCIKLITVAYNNNDGSIVGKPRVNN